MNPNNNTNTCYLYEFQMFLWILRRKRTALAAASTDESNHTREIELERFAVQIACVFGTTINQCGITIMLESQLPRTMERDPPAAVEGVSAAI